MVDLSLIDYNYVSSRKRLKSYKYFSMCYLLSQFLGHWDYDVVDLSFRLVFLFFYLGMGLVWIQQWELSTKVRGSWMEHLRRNEGLLENVWSGRIWEYFSKKGKWKNSLKLFFPIFLALVCISYVFLKSQLVGTYSCSIGGAIMTSKKAMKQAKKCKKWSLTPNHFNVHFLDDE